MKETRGQSVGNKRALAFLCLISKGLQFLVTPLDSDKRKIRLPHASAINIQCLCWSKRCRVRCVPWACRSLALPSSPNRAVKSLLTLRDPLGIVLPDDVFRISEQCGNVGNSESSNKQALRGRVAKLVRMPCDASRLENLGVYLAPVFCEMISVALARPERRIPIQR